MISQKELKKRKKSNSFNRENSVNEKFAKLLASENITVVVTKRATASFDLVRRVLYLPDWSDMSYHLRVYLTGHEVGHALHTPREKWVKVLEKEPRLESCLNVCEDIRDDRIMRNLFPGLKRDYMIAYHELWERGFFVPKGFDIKKLNFIDRLNIKYGTDPRDVTVSFAPEEMVFVKRAGLTKTFDEVVELSIDIFNHMYENQENPDLDNVDQENDPQDDGNSQENESQDDPQGENDDECNGGKSDKDDDSGSEDDENDGQGGSGSDDDDQVDENDDQGGSGSDDDQVDDSDNDGDSDDSDSVQNNDNDGDSDTDDGDTDTNGDSDDNNNPNDDMPVPSNSGGDNDATSQDDGQDDVPESLDGDKDSGDTSKDLSHLTEPEESKHDPNYVPESTTHERRERKLKNSANTTGVFYTGTLPKYKHANIVDWKTFVSHMKKTTEIFWKDYPELERIFIEQEKTIKQIYSYLRKQFEMKKQVTDYQEETRFQTGELDLDRLAEFLTNDDIFRTDNIERTDNTKHRIIMMMDCSASMRGSNLRNSMLNNMIVAKFCDVVGIPYDLYGFFSSGSVRIGSPINTPLEVTKLPGRVSTGHCQIVNMLSSDMKPSQKEAAHKAVLSMSYQSWGNNTPFNMSSTPLNEALMVISGMLSELYTEEKVSFFLTTDGDGDQNVSIHDYETNSYGTFNDKESMYVFTDPYTKDNWLVNMEDGNWHEQAVCQTLLDIIDSKCHSVNWYLILEPGEMVDNDIIATESEEFQATYQQEYEMNGLVTIPFSDQVECHVMSLTDPKITLDDDVVKGLDNSDYIDQQFKTAARNRKVFKLMCEVLTDKIA